MMRKRFLERSEMGMTGWLIGEALFKWQEYEMLMMRIKMRSSREMLQRFFMMFGINLCSFNTRNRHATRDR